MNFINMEESTSFLKILLWLQAQKRIMSFLKYGSLLGVIFLHCNMISGDVVKERTPAASPSVKRPYASDQPFVTVNIFGASFCQYAAALSAYICLIHKTSARPEIELLGSWITILISSGNSPILRSYLADLFL